MKLHGVSSRKFRLVQKMTAGWMVIHILISALAPVSFALIPETVFAQCPGGICPPRDGGGISVPPGNIGGGGINFGRGEYDQGGFFGGGFFGGGGGGIRGFLGGIIQRLMQNPAMLLLLVMLLQQLFSGFGGGGATPQRGAVEEQPIFGGGSIGPTNTGPRDGGTTVPPSSLEPAVTYRLDASGFSPSFFTIPRGQSIRIVNSMNSNRTIYSDPHDPTRATPGDVTDSCGTLLPNQECRVYFIGSGTFGFHVHENPTQHATVTVP